MDNNPYKTTFLLKAPLEIEISIFQFPLMELIKQKTQKIPKSISKELLVEYYHQHTNVRTTELDKELKYV